MTAATKHVERRAMHSTLTLRKVDSKSRTAEVAFSSELPYERPWGDEVLDHSATAVRLARLNSGGAVLMNHDPDDQVGVVERAFIDKDRKGRAIVRFGKSARASEIFDDIVEGIRAQVSVGYLIHRATNETSPDGKDVYRVTDWEPYEISIVSIPADPTVGVGRSMGHRLEIQTMPDITDDIDNPPAPASRQQRRQQRLEVGDNAQELLSQVQDINALGAMHNMRDLSDQAIREGWPIDQFRSRLLEELRKRGGPAPVAGSDQLIGMTERDVSKFSLVRMLNAMANPTDRRAQRAAAFEFECCNEARQRDGRVHEGDRANAMPIPRDVLRAPMQRDLTVGTATAGGHLVANEMRPGDFVSALRPKSLVLAMGATVLRDLNGNVVIPRQTGGTSTAWVAEGNAAAEGGMSFDQITLTPKSVSGWMEFSRKLLLQSSLDVNFMVSNDLAQAIATAIDAAAINGSGSSNQPRGILQGIGIGSVVGGTNGAAPTWDHIVQLEEAVAALNADMGSLGYVTNPKVRSKLRRTQRFASTNGEPIWSDPVDQTGMSRVAGYKAGVSTNVPSNFTKGSSSGICSAIAFGNWSDLIVGMWGGLDILVDPYTNSTTGGIRVVAFSDVDIALRRVESFAAMLDALTT